jgi:tetratricopeptide (TPR) repeat protein/predicted Ser/Thr protein kinase
MDLERARIKEAVKGRLFGSPEEPVKIGRFTVLRRLGAGGMGCVYSAYDDQLDRKVAIKLLASVSTGEEAKRAQARLLGEAQSLAQLSHPNVVAVYDVGLFDQQVYVAMEYIEGVTLRQWVARSPSWREKLAALVQVAEGLAAAHEAGLVHRDVKPDNILVDQQGRIRVVDFGLARSVDDPVVGGRRSHEDPTPTLTRTGSLLGTPAYMSPEQILGQPADPLSDQFAFCVTLYEALYGRRPFGGDSVEALRTSLVAGEIRQPRKNAKVPRWVSRVVLRGLSRRPEERFASMRELIVALARDPRARLGRIAVAALVVAALLVAAWGVIPRGEQRQPCSRLANPFAEDWSAGRQREIEASFLATGTAYAPGTWRRTKSAVDTAVKRWRSMQTSACRATHVHRRQSAAALDMQMLCLDRYAQELHAILTLFSQANRETVQRAVHTLNALPDLRDCADVKLLSRRAPPPSNRLQRVEVKRLRARLARAKSLQLLGRYPEGVRLARQIYQQARTSSYAPVRAEAAARLGSLEVWTASFAPAEQHLQQAVREGLRSGHLQAAADAWDNMIWLFAYARSRRPAAHMVAHYAEAVLDNLGGLGRLRATVTGRIGWLHAVEGSFDEALRYQRRALRMRRRLYGDADVDTGISLKYLGDLLVDMGRYGEALRHYRDARRLYSRAMSPRHPRVADVVREIGYLAAQHGRYGEAIERYREALTIFAGALGSEHPWAAGTHDLLGNALERTGQLDAAMKHYRRARAMYERSFGRTHPPIAVTLANMASVLRREGRLAAASRHLEQAQSILDRAAKPLHDDLAVVRGQLGRLHADRGQHREALSQFQQAIEILEARHGERHPRLVPLLLCVARCQRALGRSADAEAAARRALRIGEDRDFHPPEIAAARQLLARRGRRSSRR